METRMALIVGPGAFTMLLVGVALLASWVVWGTLSGLAFSPASLLLVWLLGDRVQPFVVPPTTVYFSLGLITLFVLRGRLSVPFCCPFRPTYSHVLATIYFPLLVFARASTLPHFPLTSRRQTGGTECPPIARFLGRGGSAHLFLSVMESTPIDTL